MKRLLSTVLVVVTSGIMLPAQALIPGRYLVGTQGWTPVVQAVDATKYTVQMIDPYTGQVTPLKIIIPNNEFAADFVVVSTQEFYMGTKQATKGAPVVGNVYKVTLQKDGTWLPMRVNVRKGVDGKGGLGMNVSSMVWGKDSIFVCGSGVFANTASDIQVLRILRATGQVFVHAQLGKNGAVGGGGAMVLVGATLHVFTFDSQFDEVGKAINQHWAISTNPLAPNPTWVGNLPLSNRFDPPRGYAASEALVDPRSGNIIVVGRWGELLWRTPSGVNLKRMHTPGLNPTTSLFDEAWNGCAVNTDTGELAFGDYVGAIDVYRENGPLPTVNNLVKANLPTPGVLSIDGFVYVPTPNPSVYHPIGDGCKESSGLGPWSYVNSPPTPGNKTFRLQLSTNSKTAALLVGTKRATPLDLGPAGAPGCLLHVNPLASFRVPLRAGDGTADFPVAIPAAARGLTLYLQWVVLDPKANKLGIALSEARMLRP